MSVFTGVRDAAVAVEEQNGFIDNCNWDYREVTYDPYIRIYVIYA